MYNSQVMPKIYYNTVLLQYVLERLFAYIRRMTGHSLHFRTNVRLPERAYLMFPHLDPHFEFDTEFGKTLKNQRFHHFSISLKIIKNSFKIPLSPYKIRLQSNSTKNHIFNKEITHQNTPIYNSSIPQNTSKTNTFSQRKIHK